MRRILPFRLAFFEKVVYNKREGAAFVASVSRLGANAPLGKEIDTHAKDHS